MTATVSAEVARVDSGLIHTVLDEVAAKFAGTAYHAEVTEAREDYFTRSGKVFEDDAEIHEARTLAFLEFIVCALNS